MGWIKLRNSFSPFAEEEWSKSLRANMEPNKWLLQGCSEPWAAIASFRSGEKNLLLAVIPIFIKTRSCVPPIFVVHMMSNIFLPSGMYLRPQRSPDIGMFLIADLWCSRRPAMCHSSLWGSFVPRQSWTKAMWWPRLHWSSSSLFWGFQESWGDCCVAK